MDDNNQHENKQNDAEFLDRRHEESEDPFDYKEMEFLNDNSHEIFHEEELKDSAMGKNNHSNSNFLNNKLTFNLFSAEDEHEVNKSKTSGVSLLKELEDKWDRIEQGRKRNTNKVNLKPNPEIHGASNTKSFSKKDFLTNFKESKSNDEEFLPHKIPSTNTVNLSLKASTQYNDDEFEQFVISKTKELEKFKKKSNTGANVTVSQSLFPNDHNNHMNRQNCPTSNSESEIVLASNSNARRRGTENKNNKPSFLKSNTEHSNKPQLQFRGTVFDHCDSNNIDSLVYETGFDNKREKVELNHSKELLNKMQSIFNIITEPNIKSNNSNGSDTKQNSYNDNKILVQEDNYTLNNLEDNFHNILKGINPNLHCNKLDISLKINQKAKERSRKILNDTDCFRTINHDTTQSKQVNKVCLTPNERNRNESRFFTKIEANKNLLDTLYNANKKENTTTIYCDRSNTSVKGSENDKLRMSSNQFGDLITRLSTVGSYKIRKLINSNK